MKKNAKGKKGLAYKTGHAVGRGVRRVAGGAAALARGLFKGVRNPAVKIKVKVIRRVNPAGAALFIPSPGGPSFPHWLAVDKRKLPHVAAAIRQNAKRGKGRVRIVGHHVALGLPAYAATNPCRNPKKHGHYIHVAGLPEHYQKMYDAILQASGARYGERKREVAARTVRKAASKGNPGKFVKKAKAVAVGSLCPSCGSKHVFSSDGSWYFRKVKKGECMTCGADRTDALTKGKKKNAARPSVVRSASTPCPNCKGKKLEVKDGKTVCASCGLRRNPRKKNSAGAAARKVFAEFRGKVVSGKAIKSAPDGTPSHLGEAGKLRELRLRGGRYVRRNKIPRGTVLAFDGRRRLHIVGFKRGAFKARSQNPGESIDLGEILHVVYEADKPHIDHGQVTEYIHEFGDDGKKRPHLVIDAEGLPHIKGGEYGITADGIIH